MLEIAEIRDQIQCMNLKAEDLGEVGNVLLALTDRLDRLEADVARMMCRVGRIELRAGATP